MRYSWFNISFLWQIPTALARIKYLWGYDQETLLHSMILQNLLLKPTATQQKSLVSLVIIVLNNRLSLAYLFAEWESISATVNTTCCTWINTSGDVETQAEQASWLKKVIPSMGSFSDLPDSDWFGSWGTWLQSAFQILGIILLIRIMVIPLV